MITPAKWQAKGGLKNEAFRRDIVPYMSKIVYYPDCSDIFEIGEVGGISYYKIEHKKVGEHAVTEICKKNKKLNSTGVIRNFDCEVLDIIGNDIIKKIGSFVPFELKNHNTEAKHKIYTNNLAAIGGSKNQGTYLLSKDGKLQLLAQSKITHDIVQE